MNAFLTKLKLQDTLEVSLDISKEKFLNRLHVIVDERDPGFFGDFLDAFSSNKKEYKGSISTSGFKIKRKRKIFEKNIVAVATGRVSEMDDTLFLKININGFQKFLLLFYILFPLIYTALLTGFIRTGFSENEPLFIPFILLHATLMLGIPYIIMRRSTKRLKHDLECELFLLTKPQ